MTWRFIVILCFLPSMAHAVSRYVDGQISPSSCGTYSIANRNCSGTDGNAYKTIAGCLNAFSAGDTCFLRAGTYNEAITKNNVSGTLNNYLTVKVYNSEIVIWNGGSSPALVLTNASFWQIGEGITFRAPTALQCIRIRADNSAASPVTCDGQANTNVCKNKIIGNIFDDCTGQDTPVRDVILITATNGKHSRGNEIVSNTITNFARVAIALKASQNANGSTNTFNVVENNIIDNAGSTKTFVTGAETGDWTGIATSGNGGVDNNTIRRNLIRNLVDETGSSNPKGLWCDVGQQGNLYDSNVIYNIDGKNPLVNDGRGIFDEHTCTNSTFTRNVIVDSGTGWNTANNNGDIAPTFAYNVVDETRNWDICLQKSKQATIHSNILTSTNRALMVYRPVASNSGTPLTGADKPTFANNWWTTGTGNVAQLGWAHGDSGGACPDNVAADKTVAQLVNVATSETVGGRTGIAEANTTNRQASDTTLFVDPNNATVANRNYSPKAGAGTINGCGTTPSGYVGSGWECGPFELPEVISAAYDGVTIEVCFANFYSQIVPSTGITGFTASKNGGAWALNGTGTRTSANCLDLTPATSAVGGDTLTISYSGGNLAGDANLGNLANWDAFVVPFSNFAVENNAGGVSADATAYSFTNGPVVVDGSLAEWVDVPFRDIPPTTHIGPAGENANRIRFLWDTTNLYWSGNVTDSTVFMDSGSQWWNDDCHELYLTVDGENFRVYACRNGTVTVQSGSCPTLTSTVVDSTATWAFEVRIPWTCLGGGDYTPVAGNIVAFDVQGNYDNDGASRDVLQSVRTIKSDGGFLNMKNLSLSATSIDLGTPPAAPVISNIQISNVTADAFTTTAETNEAATCLVRYEPEPFTLPYDSATTSTSSGTTHSRTPGSLTAETTYHFQWECTDGVNTSNSDDLTVTTEPSTPTEGVVSLTTFNFYSIGQPGDAVLLPPGAAENTNANVIPAGLVLLQLLLECPAGTDCLQAGNTLYQNVDGAGFVPVTDACSGPGVSFSSVAPITHQQDIPVDDVQLTSALTYGGGQALKQQAGTPTFFGANSAGKYYVAAYYLHICPQSVPDSTIIQFEARRENGQQYLGTHVVPTLSLVSPQLLRVGF